MVELGTRREADGRGQVNGRGRSPRRTSKLIVLPGTDGVEPHVAHTTPHHAVFPVARDSAPLLYARKIGSVEHGRASFPEGRLRSLVQPPPPQHLGGFGKALVEALDDDMSRRGRHRDAQHTAGHPCLVHWRRLARKFLGDECPATTRRCRVRQSVGGGSRMVRVSRSAGTSPRASTRQARCRLTKATTEADGTKGGAAGAAGGASPDAVAVAISVGDGAAVAVAGLAPSPLRCGTPP